MEFIYFHGFNSSGSNSDKIKSLRKLGNVEFINYDSFADFQTIKNHLTKAVIDKIRSNIEVDYILCGTSLGGFWAATISKETGLPAILINPSINPKIGLKEHIGIEMENYGTGEKNILKEESLSQYPKIPNVGKFIILVDSGDDVINPNKTIEYFQHNTKYMFDGGSHRFDHMEEALPLIEKWYNHVQTSI